MERKIKTEVKEEGVGERGNVLLTWFTLLLVLLFAFRSLDKVGLVLERKVHTQMQFQLCEWCIATCTLHRLGRLLHYDCQQLLIDITWLNIPHAPSCHTHSTLTHTVSHKHTQCHAQCHTHTAHTHSVTHTHTHTAHTPHNSNHNCVSNQLVISCSQSSPAITVQTWLKIG